ncbi:MAG: hypothetical protein B7Y59_07180 [Burkholderiales bacterium 35-55-47]|uniref:hypothetical protein n=1 Tax=Limnohabitans sp. TaxID=1907725 RepID=UPI000BD26F39|nr:hypothetical protein [Limnohabitans sp.]OYY18870.1 MAG: hypothetical protein B7Y59_07180 [Burkholderiales bacterium 35-55-47]OYZ73689.1 MAG: hypothetical protein B7Y06_06610 [Burkholderiales bacterium 24-55-52]OZB00834.1 MAG: hypothetical protein B7X62_06625 [Burkholderiales bacterium 39-55-53]HQR85398.1 hypothetical protein [Limnohabitans sp.]HQS26685.1 hypothetical protein [Limnohabitans sp.]
MARYDEGERPSDFPFSGQLIDGRAAADWLLSKASAAPSGVSLCSAFLRSEAMRALYSGDQVVYQGRILARWRLGDLLSGASDLDAYPMAKRLGFSFFVRQDFHGKVFSVPGSGIVVGSANATLSGFGLKDSANSEVCTLVPDSRENQSLLNEIFEGSIEMTDAIFEEMSAVVREAEMSQDLKQEWPSELMDKLQAPEFSGRLLFSECLVSIPEIDASGNVVCLDDRDLHLLGVSARGLDSSTLERAFKGTRIFRWLVHALKASEGEMYFGALTERLHNTLLDDPVVYRRDVKTVLQTLLQWCQLLEAAGVIVDRPNHSQRVRLS